MLKNFKLFPVFKNCETQSTHAKGSQIFVGFMLCLASGIVPSHASEVNCAQIENARARLACFDTQYPRDANKPNVIPRPPAPSVQKQPQQSSPSNVAQPTPGPGASQSGASSQQTQQSNPQAADQAPIYGGKSSKSGLFGNRVEVDFASKIVGVKAELNKKMVFRLENEQIWVQHSPRELPIKKGQTVTIKSGTIGGYFLHTEDGVSTRVRRIK